jgi:hypothetical protein
LDEEQFGSIIWPNIKQELKKEVKEHSLDSLYFILVGTRKFPNTIKLRKLIGFPELICEDSIQEICEKLMVRINNNITNKHALCSLANIIYIHTYFSTLSQSARGISNISLRHLQNNSAK